MKRITKVTVIAGLTVGFVAVGGGIALAATSSPAVQSGPAVSSVSSNDHGNDGKDDRNGGKDDHGHDNGGDRHGGNGRH